MKSASRFTPLPLSPAMVPYIDEVPLWSAPFGLHLLNQIRYKPGITALDIGFGTGFPLTEIALRLGNKSVVYGIDPWKEATERARQKLEMYGITNVRFIEGSAEHIPLGDETIDLITSNNGINNISNIGQVFAECTRICRPGAQFIQTMNTGLSMVEFYGELEAVLREMGMAGMVGGIQQHIEKKRPPLEGLIAQMRTVGFTLRILKHDQFDYTFVDGTTLLNHYFIRLAFLESWMDLVPSDKVDAVFAQVEKRLNARAQKYGNIRLSIPFVVIDAVRD